VPIENQPHVSKFSIIQLIEFELTRRQSFNMAQWKFTAQIGVALEVKTSDSDAVTQKQRATH